MILNNVTSVYSVFVFRSSLRPNDVTGVQSLFPCVLVCFQVSLSDISIPIQAWKPLLGAKPLSVMHHRSISDITHPFNQAAGHTNTDSKHS